LKALYGWKEAAGHYFVDEPEEDREAAAAHERPCRQAIARLPPGTKVINGEIWDAI
jgi:hypothetical protein